MDIEKEIEGLKQRNVRVMYRVLTNPVFLHIIESPIEKKGLKEGLRDAKAFVKVRGV